MRKNVSIGIIGLDTSHVSAFARLLNDPTQEHHVPGGRVTVAFPGGSPDFPLSYNRVEAFTEELKTQRGVEIVQSPQAVAEAADLVFINSVDGRVHLDQFHSIVKFKKPTFIDKPFATTSSDAREIIALSQTNGVAVMSASSLRYSQYLSEALAAGRSDILGCDVYGPMNEELTQPGLFWYGCHSIEMMVAAMGAGCVEVRCQRNERHDSLTAIWLDGRVATLHGLRGAHSKFGITLHKADGPVPIDASGGRPYYAGLLQAIMQNLPLNRSPIPADEMLHIVSIIEAANSSRAADGKPVTVQ